MAPGVTALLLPPHRCRAAAGNSCDCQTAAQAKSGKSGAIHLLIMTALPLYRSALFVRLIAGGGPAAGERGDERTG